MIFQNFGFNKQAIKKVVGPSGPTFPDQSLSTWTTTQTAAWLNAGTTLTTSNFGYSSTSTIIGSGYGGSANWYGSALAANGKIYAPPHTRGQWAVIDTTNDTVSLIGSSINNENMGAVYDKITNQVFAFGNGGTKVVCSSDTASNLSGPGNRNGGVVQSLDGNKLYTIGLFGNDNIYEWNISSATSTSKVGVGADRYTAGTLAANGSIYWGAGGGTQFTQYTPSTNTLNNFGSFSGDWTGPMVAHYDGYLYNFPRFSNSNIIRLNPSDNSYTNIATLSISPQIISTQACIGLDGRIYVTRENGAVYWYDPYSNTSGDITMAYSNSSFAGITLGAYGDLYCIPYNGGNFHKIALTTGAGATANAIVQQYNFGGRMVWPG